MAKKRKASVLHTNWQRNFAKQRPESAYHANSETLSDSDGSPASADEQPDLPDEEEEVKEPETKRNGDEDSSQSEYDSSAQSRSLSSGEGLFRAGVFGSSSSSDTSDSEDECDPPVGSWGFADGEWPTVNATVTYQLDLLMYLSSTTTIT